MALPAWSSVLIALGGATLLAIIAERLYHHVTKPPFKPLGKHCFITGGSTGLGKGLAIELAKAGADITIIARRLEELEKAVIEIKSHCQNKSQKVIAISADVTSKEDIVSAF
ncbi:unnamed protein product [Cunninghamella blakesleeana]